MKNINLSNIILITRKELKHYLDAPHSYVLLAVFLIITGYFFAQPLFLINQANLNSIVDIAPLILTFFIPAITMKLIAEEKKTQTIEIILTLPINEEEIVIGKYFASLIIMLISLILMSVWSITLIILSKPDYGHIFGTYLSLFFTSLSFLSVGIFASTLSSSQITAFIIAFGICFGFYLIGKITFFLPLSLQDIASYVGIDFHISNMSRGVVDLKDIIYFVSISFVFIYLSILNLKRKR